MEERLSRFQIFRNFSQEDLAKIGGFVVERPFLLGRTLFRQDDKPDFFYLVESGLVQEVGRAPRPNGQEVIRRRVEAGEYLGHRPLIEDTVHKTTAKAVQNAHLLTIRADDFRTLLAMFPTLKERLQRISVVNRLLAMPLFASFSDDQLFQVADLLNLVEYPSGQTIFHQGEPSDAFYVIDTGQVVERAMGMVPGRQAWPKYLTAGNFFGRFGLLNNTTRRATAEAVTDVQLFRLSAESFNWLRKLQPEFQQALKRQDILEHLRRTGVFARLSETELKELAGYVGLAHFRPQHVLYRQGEFDPTLYMLYQGEAIIRARDPEGKERPLDYLQAGDSVGEASLFLQEPRDVTVESTTKSDWLYLTRADLDQFLAQRPELIEKVIPRREVTARQRLARLPWMEPDEQLVLRRRRHWFYVLDKLLLPGLLLFAALLISRLGPSWRNISWGLFALALLWILWRVIDWFNDYYLITTSRVAHREKVLLVRESRDETPLDKIQNINIAQGLVGNAFGFGTLLIDTAAVIGASRVIFDYLADPKGVQQEIFGLVSRARAGERVEMRQTIRDKLEETIGPRVRPEIPRPAVPSPVPLAPPPPPRPSLWTRLEGATIGRVFWIEKRTGNQIIWRKHWIRLLRRIWLPSLAIVLLLLALITYLTLGGQASSTSAWLVLLLLGLLLAAVGWLWWNWEDWGNDQYIVTRDRIIDTEALPLGFRSRRTETTFDRIQNVSFDIPHPLATILNYGTVIIYTAGVEGRLDFDWVRDPKGIQAEIFRRLGAYEAARRREQREERWVDMPQWFAVYEETHRS